MAGRRVAGIGQLLLASAGFIMVIGWFVLHAVQIYNQLVNGTEPASAAWLGLTGAAVFIAAWLWSLVTSIQILRAAKEETEPVKDPPRLS